MLLLAGADMELRDRWGNTALMMLGWPLGYLNIFPIWFQKDPIYPQGSKYMIIIYLPKTCITIIITQNPSTSKKKNVCVYIYIYIGYLDPLGTEVLKANQGWLPKDLALI